MQRSIFIAVTAGVALCLPLLPARAQTSEEITREKILAHGPVWQEKHDAFEPAADMLDAIKQGPHTGLEIDVYLGLWCPDSRNNVPLFVKIMDRLALEVPVRYFDVPRKPSSDVTYYVEEFEVRRVPTFIFRRDGREIGRIVENPEAGMLEDMMDILLR
ncbi:MAG: hypothetical protein FJW35_10400 [Acidobacteria bacterium]|nr:hypothetical protein [Acidobacteriota bacterium]